MACACCDEDSLLRIPRARRTAWPPSARVDSTHGDDAAGDGDDDDEDDAAGDGDDDDEAAAMMFPGGCGRARGQNRSR